MLAPALRSGLAIGLAAHLAKTRSAAWGAATDETMLTNWTRLNTLGALPFKHNALTLQLAFDWHAAFHLQSAETDSSTHRSLSVGITANDVDDRRLALHRE